MGETDILWLIFVLAAFGSILLTALIITAFQKFISWWRGK